MPALLASCQADDGIVGLPKNSAEEDLDANGGGIKADLGDVKKIYFFIFIFLFFYFIFYFIFLIFIF